MRRDIWRRFVAVGLCWVALACGDDDLATEAEAVATLEPVRGEGALARVGTGERTEVSGLARLSLDAGARALLFGTAFTVSPEGELVIEGGRAFVEVPEGDALTIAIGETRLFVRDAAISIEDGRAHVLRGEASFRRGEDRGRVRAGEHLALADLRVSSDVLWEDWTGGLARTGPGPPTRRRRTGGPRRPRAHGAGRGGRERDRCADGAHPRRDRARALAARGAAHGRERARGG